MANAAADCSLVSKRDDLVSLMHMLAHVALVLAPIYIAAATPLGWHTLLLFLWFGLVQHGLTNLMHEASHWHVFARKAWNDVLGFWVLGPFFLADFALYRTRHWVHHRETGTDLDTKTTYLISLRGSHGLAFLLRAMVVGHHVKRAYWLLHALVDEPAP